MRANPLSRVSIRDHVPVLQARGATVLFDDLIVFSEPEIYNGNLFVLPVDESLAAGRSSSLDWTRRFYEHFDDDFDFLVFVVNLYDGDYDNPGTSTSYFGRTHNDVRGIGRPISSDNRWPNGLQGVVVHKIVSSSVDSRSILHTGPMLHELMHRWAAYVTPNSGSGSHWGFRSANGTLGGFGHCRSRGPWRGALFGRGFSDERAGRQQQALQPPRIVPGRIPAAGGSARPVGCGGRAVGRPGQRESDVHRESGQKLFDRGHR